MTREVVQFTSRDGIRLGAVRSGTGPPLLLVHGTAADHARWNIVLPRLEAKFTCYALDRRGRGLSGDSPAYSVEREIDDVSTVIDSLSGPVDALGHSFGGLLALEAALRTTNIRRLIVYEPAAFAPASGVYGAELLERLDWLAAMGDREQLTITMLRDVAGLPQPTIDILRRQPYWKNRLAVAHTVPRELRADADYHIDENRLRRIRTPTLLLLGERSPHFYREGTERILRGLPNGFLETLSGQEHAAMDTASRMFTDAVLRFLTATELPPRA